MVREPWGIEWRWGWLGRLWLHEWRIARDRGGPMPLHVLLLGRAYNGLVALEWDLADLWTSAKNLLWATYTLSRSDKERHIRQFHRQVQITSTALSSPLWALSVKRRAAR